MKPAAIIPVAISDVCPVSDRVVKVMFEAGGSARLPRDEIDFTPGLVWLPEWLHRKIRAKTPCGPAAPPALEKRHVASI